MRSLRFQMKVSVGLLRQTLRLLVLTLLLIGGLSHEANAQAVYGRISGTISDPQGASISGASVTVTNTAQNVTTTAKTNESGFYEVTHLIPGVYQVKIEQQGYKTALQDVVVKADVVTTSDVRLEVGALAETVTITGVDLSLKTDKSDVATTFNQRQVQELPTFDRNFTRFVLLSPGTQQLPGWNHAASENPQGSLQGSPRHFIQSRADSGSVICMRIDSCSRRRACIWRWPRPSCWAMRRRPARLPTN